MRTNELRDGELLAYLAGDADAAVNAHLAECTACQQRAAALASLEQRLTTTLYRLACPSPLELGEYQLKLLSAADTHAVALHVNQCPHCAAEIAILTDYLAAVAPTIEPAAALPLAERARILVARLVEGFAGLNTPGGLTAATAGLRGDAGEQLVYEVDGVQVIIDVQTDVQQPTQRVLLGLVLGLPASQTVTAHLWRTEQAVATTMVDELGNFVIAALAPGAYDLILSSDKTEVHIQDLQI
ncbi:MAG: hypothetical protein R3E79_04515 [Caldilineaceae bacterium]